MSSGPLPTPSPRQGDASTPNPSPGASRYVPGMREARPNACWWILEGDGTGQTTCCIRDRGHDGGIHEPTESTAASVLYDVVTAQIEHEMDAAEHISTAEAVERIHQAVVDWRERFYGG